MSAGVIRLRAGAASATFARTLIEPASRAVSLSPPIGVLAADGPPLPGSGVEASEKRPRVPGPSGVEQRVMPGTVLAG